MKPGSFLRPLRSLRGEAAELTSSGSLRLAPRVPAATMLELGTACQELLRYDEAIARYKTGLEIAPADGDLHVFLALAQLTLGDYENGWREFEWRWKSTRLNTQRLEFDAPLWDGSDRSQAAGSSSTRSRDSATSSCSRAMRRSWPSAASP